jgi:two-component system cell cycle sensor histidine kinase/response regulator CckA
LWICELGSLERNARFLWYSSSVRSADELSLIASIADALPAGVWVAHVPGGELAYANRAFADIMGMGAISEVAVGEYAGPYGICTHGGEPYPEDKMPFVRALQARDVVVVDDIAIHRRDGTRIFVRAHAKPLFDEAGGITHIAIAFFDITREVLAQRDAAAAQERLARLVAGAPLVLSGFDTKGVVTFVDGHGLEALGRPREEYLGESMLDSYGPEVAERTRRALAGEPVAYSLEFQGRAYEAKLTPQRDETGAVVGVIGVSLDVTERRRAEAKLAQAERLASLGMLAAGVAHEVNNPLAYVVGSLDVMARELDAVRLPPDETRLPPEETRLDVRSLRALVREAAEGAQRVRAIVRDLKTFSRAGEPNPKRLDVRGPLEAALAMARNEVRHRARLVVDLAAAPPVLADEGRLAELFLNLLVNAAQAIEPGASERNEIAVVMSAAEGHVIVEVRDTGGGIAPEALPRIFDPFFTTKPAGVGTGLGLSLCHAITTDLGGTITAESEVGRGTVLRVSLPVARDEDDARHAVVRASAPGRRGRVLIVDDERPIGRVVTMLLGDEHDVEYEPDATGALERLQRGERYDAILCDVMMPEMSGIELHERVRSIAPEQAESFIFVTGGAFTARARDFLATVPNLVLDKPFDATELVRVIRSVTG